MLPIAPVTEHIIVIDDSNAIRSLLASAILSDCVTAGWDAYLIQSSDFGVFTHNVGIIREPVRVPDVIVGVADCARNALDLLNPLLVRRATILCDIETPQDMHVGLFGLLDHLARTRIPVNLIFMSSEAQNVHCVRQLVAAHKAAFVEKGGEMWARLPYALVRDLPTFAYNPIARADYDTPFLAQVQIPHTPAPKTVLPRPRAQLANIPAFILHRLRAILHGLRLYAIPE